LKPSNWAIAQLPGISPQDEASLVGCGIHTTFQLLQKTQTPDQRQILASEIQTHLQRVNKWVALAQLACIPTVGCQYCGLLLHAGISSPIQLAQAPIGRLHQQILKLQIATMQRQDLCPGFNEVAQWIEQATQLQTRFR
jgi:hypothetical protein